MNLNRRRAFGRAASAGAALGLAASGLALTGLAGCAALGVPERVRFSEAEIARRLGQAFPLDKRLLDVFDVRVAEPRLRLRPANNRLATELSFSASDRLLGRRIEGSLALEHGLEWDPSDASLRLTQVRVEALSLRAPAVGADLVGDPLRGFGRRLAALVAEQLLEGRVLYRPSAQEQERWRALGVRPGVVNVLRDAVEITLVAAAPPPAR